MSTSTDLSPAQGESAAPAAPHTFRTVIADDEPLARQRLRAMLAAHADFAVVAECGDGTQLMEAVHQHEPDLVLLDIQMPSLDGVSAWRGLARSGRRLPLVIFVTAHLEYAVDAFEVQALDYLLKPVSRARFDQALERVRSVAGPQAVVPLPPRAAAGPAPSRPEMLVLKHDGEYHFVRIDDIIWAGAEGDFVKVHTGAGTHLVRQSLASLEAVLDPRLFLRLHRSHLVARHRIRKVFVVQRGDYAVVMSDGAELRVSRAYFDSLKQLIAEHAM